MSDAITIDELEAIVAMKYFGWTATRPPQTANGDTWYVWTGTSPARGQWQPVPLYRKYYQTVIDKIGGAWDLTRTVDGQWYAVTWYSATENERSILCTTPGEAVLRAAAARHMDDSDTASAAAERVITRHSAALKWLSER